MQRDLIKNGTSLTVLLSSIYLFINAFTGFRDIEENVIFWTFLSKKGA